MSPEVVRYLEQYDERRVRQTLARGVMCRSREGIRVWIVLWPAIPTPPTLEVAEWALDEYQPCAA